MSVRVLGVFKGAKETRELPAGTVIFEEGSTGEEMFGIIAGRVELRMANGIPVGMGCGSSAAVRLAGVALASAFGGLDWDAAKIVELGKLAGHAA